MIKNGVNFVTTKLELEVGGIAVFVLNCCIKILVLSHVAIGIFFVEVKTIPATNQ